MEEIRYTLHHKDIAERATSILRELRSGNITASLIRTYYAAGIIPPRLRKDIEGTPMFTEEAALWAAVGKGLFLSRHGVKLEWIGRVLCLAVPAAYGKSLFKLVPFSDIKDLWNWFRANGTWGKFLRYLINSGIEVGEEEHQLPPYIAGQADQSSV